MKLGSGNEAGVLGHSVLMQVCSIFQLLAVSSYSLFAVVNHSGSLHNGHYTCYVRQQQDQVTRTIVLRAIM